MLPRCWSSRRRLSVTISVQAHGDLDEAIASSRRVRKLAPLVTEALFWEAMSHVQRGRMDKAYPLLQLFVSRPRRSKRSRDLWSEANQLLLDTTTGTA